MTPAMMLTWIFGLYLAWSVYGFHGGWLHAKIGLVVLLTGVHMFFSRAVGAFERDENRRSARYWRFMNEAPTVLMVVIVILVVVKPF
jgi:putative membrane protein